VWQIRLEKTNTPSKIQAILKDVDFSDVIKCELTHKIQDKKESLFIEECIPTLVK
jgi:hypothetical protein